jgi:hypothetical protein
MRSPDWRRFAAALAAAAVALALTSCTSSPRASSSTAAAARAASATSQTPRQRAEKAAAGILASFVVPPGGRRLAAPPHVPGGGLSTPGIYVGATWEVHLTAFWEAPGNPLAVLAWERAHLPHRFITGGLDTGQAPWNEGFRLGPEGVLIGRELDVDVASAGGGQTGIRLDAWVAWLPPRWASSMIPPTARTATIADLDNDSAPNRLPVTITDPATVRKLADLIDGLRWSPIPADTLCPAPGSPPHLSLTFRARPGGPVLAVAQTDQDCHTVALTVRGEQQPALANDDALDGQILKLAVLPQKAS